MRRRRWFRGAAHWVAFSTQDRRIYDCVVSPLAIPAPTRTTPTGPHDHRRFEFEGRELGYPANFNSGSSMMGLFLAPLGPLNRLIADSPFAAAEVVPGRGVVTIVCVHYTDTDCGVYEEICWGCFVQPSSGARRLHPDQAGLHRSAQNDLAPRRSRPPRPEAPLARGSQRPPSPRWQRSLARAMRGQLPAYTWRLAVTTELARDAGVDMWGYPKTTEDLRWQRSEGSAAMSWRADGTEVFRFSVPDHGSTRPDVISPEVYSMFDGRPHVSNLTQACAGTGHHRNDGELVLGEHPIADELKGLGLRTRPVIAVWNEHVAFQMSAPRPL